MTEKVTLYLHSGDRLVAEITPEDIEEENDRLESLGLDGDVECAEELVESVLKNPPRPGWRWCGDAFIYTQAVAGVSTAGDTTKEN